MAQKKIVLELVGEESLIDASLDAFVRQYGWTEESVDADNNPITKEFKAKEILRLFIVDVVTAYNVNQAKITAAEATTQATWAALGGADLSLSTELIGA